MTIPPMIPAIPAAKPISSKVKPERFFLRSEEKSMEMDGENEKKNAEVYGFNIASNVAWNVAYG